MIIDFLVPYIFISHKLDEQIIANSIWGDIDTIQFETEIISATFINICKNMSGCF